MGVEDVCNKSGARLAGARDRAPQKIITYVPFPPGSIAADLVPTARLPGMGSCPFVLIVLIGSDVYLPRK
jgi:hypothetical protein